MVDGESIMLLTRRRFLALLPASLAALLAACSGDDDGDETANSPAGTEPQPTSATASSNTGQVAPTPACGDDDDDPTVAQTEGPFFTPSSPERVSLIESGISGTKLVLEGVVVSTSCQPVAGAMVDFWQCDDAGNYDNQGYRLRGHQFTKSDGTYRLETIVPGLYTGRTRHIHVKVQAPNRPVLTTQLYFPNEPGNQRDGIFNQSLVLDEYRDDAGGKAGRFQFVLNV
jgi:protocatechuate 3,4-dioxygenase beta subunit